MKHLTNSILVGAFFIGSVLLFVGFLLFTGEISRWGEKNERFILVFDENVFGLNEGGKVTLNGIRVGRVERFFLGEDLELGPVPVLIEINKKLVKSHGVEVGNELFDADGNFPGTNFILYDKPLQPPPVILIRKYFPSFSLSISFSIL